MSSESAHKILTEPISVGLKVMPTRLYRPPGIGDDELMRQCGANGAVHPLGGWGTVMSGPWTVWADRTTDGDLRRWDASMGAVIERMCELAHAGGALAGVVLRCAWPASRSSLRRAERADLLRALAGVAEDARRAGCDIVTLADSSAANTPRASAGGPSITTDARREAIELVARAVGDECAIGVEMNAAAGPRLIEGVDDAVDFWVFCLEERGGDGIRLARAHTTKPLVGVGRFGSAERMAEAVESGQLDIIGPLDAGPVIRSLRGGAAT